MNKFKYCKIICLILSITLIFSSCSLKNNSFNYTEISRGYFEKLVIALQNKDKAAFKELFSKQSIESDNFDKNMDLLFDLYKGTHVISYDDKGYIMGGDLNDDGILSVITLISSFDIDTDAGIYRFSFKTNVTDIDDKDKIGILSLYFIKAEDSNMLINYNGDGEWIVGINIE